MHADTNVVKLSGIEPNTVPTTISNVLGINDANTSTYVSYNKERHGIKSMTYPELKTEYVLSLSQKISDLHSLVITLEFEKIKNFGFIENNVSVSKLVWLGYSFSIN